MCLSICSDKLLVDGTVVVFSLHIVVLNEMLWVCSLYVLCLPVKYPLVCCLFLLTYICLPLLG